MAAGRFPLSYQLAAPLARRTSAGAVSSPTSGSTAAASISPRKCSPGDPVLLVPFPHTVIDGSGRLDTSASAAVVSFHAADRRVLLFPRHRRFHLSIAFTFSSRRTLLSS